MIQCTNCKNIEFCKWEEVLKAKEESLQEDTNGMLSINCSQFIDNNGNENDYGKLECKECKFRVICKFQRPIEDFTLRRKTKQCLNITCCKFEEMDGIELLIDEEEESNGTICLSKEDE